MPDFPTRSEELCWSSESHSPCGALTQRQTREPGETLDLLARDPDGYEVVFTSRLPSDQQDPAFAARMEEVRREMLAGSHAPRQEHLPDDRSSIQQ